MISTVLGLRGRFQAAVGEFPVIYFSKIQSYYIGLTYEDNTHARTSALATPTAE